MRRQTRFIVGLVIIIGTAWSIPARSARSRRRQWRRPGPEVPRAAGAGRRHSRRTSVRRQIGNALEQPGRADQGDRITDVGAAVQIPPGASVIDLSSATVLPGMIDAHVHVNTGGETPPQRALIALANAQIDLEAGFTTVLDMDSRGGFNTVDLRDAINAGMVQGPRMQVVGQSLNQRATNYYPDIESVRFLEGFTENKNVNSPVARARGGARGEAARRRLDQDLHDAGFRRHRCTCGSRTRRWSTARR